MIILQCQECESFVNVIGRVQKCDCGKVKGKLVSNREAEFTGPAIVMTIAKFAIERAKRNIKDYGRPHRLVFTLHNNYHPRIHKVNEITWEN